MNAVIQAITPQLDFANDLKNMKNSTGGRKRNQVGYGINHL